MLKKNNVLTGILGALIMPVIAFIVAYILKNNVDIINRPALPYFIAIAANLFLIRYSLKKGLDQTARGVMLTTFICLILVIIFKIHPIR